MLRGLLRNAWDRIRLLGRRFLVPPDRVAALAPFPTSPEPLQALDRVILSDGVARTLFDDFAAHRDTARGAEEIGWLLLGRRECRQATALATLPAGTQRQAGVAHVMFNSDAQGLACRIVRQWDKQLVPLGVVHTHPGSLRHPSGGDFQGDSRWVSQLRGGEGIFGIGTADVEDPDVLGCGRQPVPHQQILGELCFTWYALARGQRSYRPLPVTIALGPDLARPLHSLWPVIEEHEQALERLCRQQAHVRFDVIEGGHGKTLAVSLPLAAPNSSLKLLLDGRETQYLVQERDMLSRVDPEESRLDRAVYLILAELAGARERKARPAGAARR